MAHAQKPDFVFRRNGRDHLNRRGRQFSRLLAAEVSASAFIVGSNAGYAMFRGSVKGTGYPLHSPVSPSLPLPCVTVCYHISTGVYSEPFPSGQSSQEIRLTTHLYLALRIAYVGSYSTLPINQTSTWKVLTGWRHGMYRPSTKLRNSHHHTKQPNSRPDAVHN